MSRITGAKFKFNDKVQVSPALLKRCQDYLDSMPDPRKVIGFPHNFIGMAFPIQMYKDIIIANRIGKIYYRHFLPAGMVHPDQERIRYDVVFTLPKIVSYWTLPEEYLCYLNDINVLGNFPKESADSAK